MTVSYFLIDRNAMWHPGDRLGYSLNARNAMWNPDENDLELILTLAKHKVNTTLVGLIVLAWLHTLTEHTMYLLYIFHSDSKLYLHTWNSIVSAIFRLTTSIREERNLGINCVAN